MATRLAPIYNALWTERRKIQVRLPDPELIRFIRLMLKDPFPFFIPIFDTTDSELQLAGGALAALLSTENRVMLAEDFWWFGTVASFSVGSQTNSPFSFQLFHTINVGAENEVGYQHQQKPVNAENCFGTAQKPFYLTTPKLFRRDTEVICKVSNSQNAANTIQTVLMGYVGEPAGGLI